MAAFDKWVHEPMLTTILISSNHTFPLQIVLCIYLLLDLQILLVPNKIMQIITMTKTITIMTISKLIQTVD